MKKLLYIALFSLTFTWGCSDWLDVNTDPNNLNELPNSNALIPSAEMSIANTIMGWDMGFGGGYWSQYMAQNYNASQFKKLEEYSEAEFSTAYTELTAGALNDLKRIQTIALANNDEGSYLLSEVLSIYVWQIMTDTWGDIPYFQTLQGNDNLSPDFDNGQVIYADLLKRINALLEKDFSNAMIKTSSDFLLGGDVNKWVAFANSLKLKLMLRLSETSGYNNAEVLSFIESATLISESVKISGSVFEDKDGKRHPMAEFELGKANYLSTNVIASKTLLDFLSENNDPRLSTIYDAPASGVQQGAFQGDFDSDEDSDGDGTLDEKETYSTMSFDVKMDIPLMSLWEVEFYIAEVYARAGDHVNAKLHYDNGVNASMAAHGFTNSITTAGGYAAWVDGTVEEEIEQISIQKWVSYAKYQHWEAFLERNRTKYPSVSDIDVEADRKFAYKNFPIGQFTVSVKGRAKLSGNLPASPIYPNDVLTRNTSASKPSQKPNIGVKIWWNQKAGK